MVSHSLVLLTLAHSYSTSLTHWLTLTHSYSRSLTRSHSTHSLTHSQTHSLTHALTRIPFSHCLSLTSITLTRILTHSHAFLLNHLFAFHPFKKGACMHSYVLIYAYTRSYVTQFLLFWLDNWDPFAFVLTYVCRSADRPHLWNCPNWTWQLYWRWVSEWVCVCMCVIASDVVFFYMCVHDSQNGGVCLHALEKMVV